MRTLLGHVTEGLAENCSMNLLDHWFDGFGSAVEALEFYADSYNDEPTPEELECTLKAIQLMFDHDVDDAENAIAQAAIEEFNIEILGQDFSHNGFSVAI